MLRFLWVADILCVVQAPSCILHAYAFVSELRTKVRCVLWIIESVVCGWLLAHNSHSAQTPVIVLWVTTPALLWNLLP